MSYNLSKGEELYWDAAEPYWKVYFQNKDFNACDDITMGSTLKVLKQHKREMNVIKGRENISKERIREIDEMIKSNYR
jgi:hypothetical protein